MILSKECGCHCKEDYHEQIDELQREVDDLKEMMGGVEFSYGGRLIAPQHVDGCIEILNEITDGSFEKVGVKNLIGESTGGPEKKYGCIENMLEEFFDSYEYLHTDTSATIVIGGETYEL